MIEPGNRFTNRCHARAIRKGRSPEHQYRDPERSGGRNLAVGGPSPAVLRHNDVDAERLEQRPIVTLGEGTPRKNVVGPRRSERRLDRIDTADEVLVLRGGSEWSQLLPSDRQKDPARALPQRTNRVLRIGYLDPDIAVNGGPPRPAKSENRRVGLRSGSRGIGRNRFGVRMGRINEEIDALVAKMRRKTLSTPEAAPADWDGLSGGRRRTAGKRHREDEFTVGERDCKLASLRGPSKNQYVRAHVQPQP